MKQKLIIEIDVDPKTQQRVPEEQQQVRLNEIFGEIIESTNLIHKKWSFMSLHNGEELVPDESTITTKLESC